MSFLTIRADLSEPMLHLARERAAIAGVSVEHLTGDMRNFDLACQFALILIARNSLLHLHSTEDLLATFTMVRRHLAQGGLFAFDIFNPKVRLLARSADERFPVMQVETEAFGTLSVETTSDYDAATQVNYNCWYVSAPGKPDAISSLGLAEHLSAGVAATSRGGGISAQESRGRTGQSAIRFIQPRASVSL
jgi:SAM-dependent methyltransferase